jgi:hypothetical protein
LYLFRKVLEALLSYGAKQYDELVGGLVTHLLVGKDFEDIHIEVARDLYKIKIVTSRWVKSSLKAQKLLPIGPPIFLGYVATTTGLGSDDVKRIWIALNFHSGEYFPRLVVGQVNLLICGKASGVCFRTIFLYIS